MMRLKKELKDLVNGLNSMYLFTNEDRYKDARHINKRYVIISKYNFSAVASFTDQKDALFNLILAKNINSNLFNKEDLK